MTDAQNRLRSTEAAWEELKATWLGRIKALREEAAKDCRHPTELLVSFNWWHRNGYGSHKECRGVRCTCCGKLNHYPTISNQWSRPEDCVRDNDD